MDPINNKQVNKLPDWVFNLISDCIIIALGIGVGYLIYSLLH